MSLSYARRSSRASIRIDMMMHPIWCYVNDVFKIFFDFFLFSFECRRRLTCAGAEAYPLILLIDFCFQKYKSTSTRAKEKKKKSSKEKRNITARRTERKVSCDFLINSKTSSLVVDKSIKSLCPSRRRLTTAKRNDNTFSWLRLQQIFHFRI